MSEDIKARLREASEGSYMCGEWNCDPDDLDEAADRIEALEAEVARLRRSRDRYREEWERARAHQEVAATRAIKRARLAQDNPQPDQSAGDQAADAE